MPLSVVVSFVVVFALSLLAVSVGLRFFDARRKNQVVEMLHTASGESVTSVSNLLKEIETEKPSGLKRLLSTMQFSKFAAEQIQQAGVTWSANRLMTAMVLLMIPRLRLGIMIPFLFNAAGPRHGLRLVFGSMPYLVVRA